MQDSAGALMGWANDQIALLIVTAGSTFSGIFVYSPSPGTGNLVDSITAATLTDPYGNLAIGGIVNYQPGASPIAIQTSGAFIRFSQAASEAGPYTPFATFGPLGADFQITTTGNIQLFSGAASSIIANNPLEVLAATDLDGALDVSGLATFNGQVNVLTLPVNIEAMATPATPGSGTKLFSPNSGGLQGHLQTVGTDGNVWATEALTFITQTQSITLTTPVALTGISVPVTQGTTYKIRAMIPYSSTAVAGFPTFNYSLAGGATDASGFTSAIFGVPGATVTMNFRNTSATANITGPTLASGQSVMWLEGIILIGVSNGTLTFTTQLSNAADPYSIVQGGYFEISPVA